MSICQLSGDFDRDISSQRKHRHDLTVLFSSFFFLLRCARVEYWTLLVCITKNSVVVVHFENGLHVKYMFMIVYDGNNNNCFDFYCRPVERVKCLFPKRKLIEALRIKITTLHCAVDVYSYASNQERELNVCSSNLGLIHFLWIFKNSHMWHL